MLLEGGKVVALKGKDAESATAMAYYRMAKITGEAKYTKAALHLAELTIKRMRSSAIGLLDIKEWGPNKIMYGAPPPLGWYGAYTSAILGSHDRMDDVRFIGGAWIGTHGMRVAGGLPYCPICGVLYTRPIGTSTQSNEWRNLMYTNKNHPFTTAFHPILIRSIKRLRCDHLQ